MAHSNCSNVNVTAPYEFKSINFSGFHSQKWTFLKIDKMLRFDALAPKAEHGDTGGTC